MKNICILVPPEWTDKPGDSILAAVGKDNALIIFKIMPDTGY